jgi:hypothetical protein
VVADTGAVVVVVQDQLAAAAAREAEVDFDTAMVVALAVEDSYIYCNSRVLVHIILDG